MSSSRYRRHVNGWTRRRRGRRLRDGYGASPSLRRARPADDPKDLPDASRHDSTAYSYDNLGRLTGAYGNGHSLSFT